MHRIRGDPPTPREHRRDGDPAGRPGQRLYGRPQGRLAATGFELPGIHGSPNLHDHPDLYEVENKAVDPGRLIEAAMWRIAPWAGRVLIDVGAGTGFHIARFHADAAHVFAVEPHGPSRLRAMRRVADLELDRASVLAGSAASMPLRDACAGVAHARFAYFVGPGCEPGIRELRRVLSPGGTAFVIDNDWDQGTFAGWLRRSRYVAWIDPVATGRFWNEQGFQSVLISSEWRFESRADLEAVIGIEFPAELAAEICAEHRGLSVSYAFRLYHRTF